MTLDEGALLASLRAVFREELEDQLASLEREVEALSSGDTARAREAEREIYRAIHSLKGAAGAANAADIERLCHEAESRLAGVRGAPTSARDVAEVTHEVTQRLRSLAAAFEATTPAPSAPATPGAAARPGERAVRPDEPLNRPTEGPAGPTAPAVSAAPPPPRDARAAEARPAETVRVPVSRLGELAAVSEDLVALAARSGEGALAGAAIDDMLAEVRSSLSRARLLAKGRPAEYGSRELVSTLEHSMHLVQTVRLEALRGRERDDRARRELAATAAHLSGRARALRVVPIGELAETLESAGREAARDAGVSASVRVLGGDVEVERRVRDNLREPLLHLVRNAIAHGIERPAERAKANKPAAGAVVIRASVAAREITLTVEDDGRGVDVGAVRAAAAARGLDAAGLSERETYALLFEPGFTTAAATTTLAGRGVGLDVVRQRVAAMHGRIDVASAPGAGTRFTLAVPTDLGTARGLVVAVRDARVVIVTSAVERVRTVAEGDTRAVDGKLFVLDREALVPLVDLAEALGLARRPSPRAPGGRRPCAIVAAGDQRVALAVDAVAEERDLIVRALPGRFRRTAFVSGATLLDDGEVALVLDVGETVAWAGPTVSRGAGAAPRRRRVLVADDSITTRQLVRSILEASGFEVAVAKDGEEAWRLLSSEEAFDAVVSDVEMPGLDGFQLLARVRRGPRASRLPFVLVTALDKDEDRQRALELGASAYFVKSGFDQGALVDTIESLL